MNERPGWTFQFRLSELFVAVTTFAVVFAMVGWWGLDGLGAGMFVAAACVTVMEWHGAIKNSLGW